MWILLCTIKNLDNVGIVAIIDALYHNSNCTTLHDLGFTRSRNLGFEGEFANRADYNTWQREKK